MCVMFPTEYGEYFFGLINSDILNGISHESEFDGSGQNLISLDQKGDNKRSFKLIDQSPSELQNRENWEFSGLPYYNLLTKTAEV